MIASFFIVFREMLEAGLIIGIALAVSRGIPGAGRWLFAGAMGGLAGSVVVAMFTGLIARSFHGTGQELFNAGALALAVIMLGWHNIWMAQHGRELASNLRQKGHAIEAGTSAIWTLALVVGLAVLREGSEVVLFSYGMLAAKAASPASILSGGLGGLLAGGAVSALLYFGLLNIPVKYLFSVTGWMIALLAAGMAAQSVMFLEQAGYVTFLQAEIWDTSGLLSQTGMVGSVLHVVAGYMDRPTGAEFLAWAATLAVIISMTWLVNKPTGQQAAKVRPQVQQAE